ncbi:zinc-dependent alcohol dehydrogenase family protein [Patulibacter minatonensis]|uniref:zinc-dependent alcohol dehydrogenase family protein n=1 Tax=Patulibacter minatonensis TaxID=298163 RepID=UPI00047B241D|nr:zinc-dependent alcohol dehydrogenase family protein [Patulibacter minatonensis]
MSTAHPTTTTAAVLRETGVDRPYDETRPLTLETLTLDPPGRGELLVRVRAAGLCHSDLSTVNGDRPRPTPMALGHEVAGEVVGLGEGTARPADADGGSGALGFAVGDHVVMAFVPSCGACDPCRQGRPALCEPGAAANGRGELLAGGRRLHDGDGDVHHHLGVSGFSDHVVVSARSVVRIDPEVPWEVAALFGCAVLTGVGAVVNAAKVRPGESVAIFGLGGVGLAAMLGAIAAGAHPVVVVDVVEEKLELARELGATHAISSGDDVVERVRAVTGGGPDHAIETVGSAGVLATAYAATRRGGVTTTVGLPHPSASLSIPAVSLTAEERTLQGSYLGSCVPERDIPRFVALYRAGRLPVDRLLTHRLRPDEINAGFERLAKGEGVRQVVVFD